MGIIDWEALRRDGMPAVHAALGALERHHAGLEAEYIRNVAALYAQGQKQAERLDYLDARRADERKIRDEIDARLRVIEEQVTNLATALTELTHDTQTDLRILQARQKTQLCAVCRSQPAVMGKDGLFCPDCYADLRAGIEDAGLAEMQPATPAELRERYHEAARPVRHTYPRKGRGDSIGTYCERCGTAIIRNAGEYTLAACEYCGHTHLSAITSVRDDRPRFPVVSYDNAPRIPQSAVRVAMRSNGYAFTPGYPAEDGADD